MVIVKALIASLFDDRFALRGVSAVTSSYLLQTLLSSRGVSALTSCV